MLKKNNNILISIVGPTAVGKTDLCIKLAQLLKTEIISADSRQCYKDLNLGTAKPTIEQRKAAKHHLIDFLPLTSLYNAGKFARDAYKILESLWTKNNKVLLCGGSGLYIKALSEGLNFMPETNLSIREDLNDQLIKKGINKLIDDIKTIDPEFCTANNLKNPRRILRALEIFYSSGKTYSSFLKKKIENNNCFKIIKIGLNTDREILYNRINNRVDTMIHDGLIQEARSLYHLRHLNSLFTLGYREIFDYLDNEISKDFAIELIKRNSRRYAKRQITWFQSDNEIQWFNPNQLTKIIDYIDKTENNNI